MRRRASRQTDASMSLFPFLAVLICTMGSLIVLLLVVVQQARVHAQSNDTSLEQKEAARAAAQQRLQQLQQGRENYLRQIGTLEQRRDEQQLRLSATREQLNGLEATGQRLSHEVMRLDQTNEQLLERDNDTSQRISETETALAGLRQKIGELKPRLQHRQGNSDRRPSYALIPYDGATETRRRPIYLECLADRVVLQPEGITFYDEDFRGSLGPNNPLAAALRATRAYLVRNEKLSHYEQPYPLLIVRPQGAEAYAAARAAMKSWDAEFGYELVPEDMKLSYPSKNPELAEVLLETVKIARRHRERIQLATESPRGRRAGGVYLTPSRRGGFTRVEGTDESDGSGVYAGSFAARARRDGFTRGGASSARSPNRNGPFSDAYADGDQDEYMAGGVRAGGQKQPGTGFSGRDGGSRTNYRQLASNGYREGQGGSTDYGDGGAGEEESLFSGNGDAEASRVAASPQPGFASPSDGQGWSSRGGPRSSSSDGPTSSSLGGQAAQQASSAATTGSTSQRGGSATAAGPSAPSKGSAHLQFGSSATQGSSVSALAQSRGEGWALPNAAQGILGFRRPITAHCAVDRIIVRSASRSPADGQVIPFKESTQSAVEPLVAAIWKRIEDWGIAGPGVYWKPELHVSVAPGAESRFVELQALLKDSGIPIVRGEQRTVNRPRRDSFRPLPR